MNDDFEILIVTQAPIDEAALEPVRAVAPRVRLVARTAESLASLGGVWPAVEVAYTSRDLPTPAQTPNLRWVQTHFAGVDHVLSKANPILERITLTTSSGIHATAMAEYALMMMLAFAHKLPRMAANQARAIWAEDRWTDFVPRELRGATLGVLGYGSIGREAARLAREFGMRVLALKRDPSQTADAGWRLPGAGDPQGVLPERFYGLPELSDFLAESDYVLLSLPLTKDSRHIIDSAALKRMRPESVLINVGRGGLVDEPALVEALRAGRIGGAGLDVFEKEPLPADSPLWSLPNVLISPHISGFMPDYDRRAMELFAENLGRYLRGEALLNQVNLPRGY